MPINLFYEQKKYEDISCADPLRLRGGQRPPRPPLIDAHGVLCRTSQSNILAITFFITHMGISCTKCRNPPLLRWAISIKQARGESATQIS